jgi:conjugative transfer signal peptidase TraF
MLYRATFVLFCVISFSAVNIYSIKLPTFFFINTTDSMPKGIYRRVKTNIQNGDIVVIDLPQEIKTKYANLEPVIRKKPLLKRVISIGGDDVCRHGNDVIIGANAVFPIKKNIRNIFPFSQERVCKTLATDEFFAASFNENSFDSRYFGPLKSSQIITKVTSFLTF